jgi:hypothetical protein
MQSALHLKTTILPGGKIEVTDLELPVGEAVEVIVLLPEPPPTARHSVLDILAEAPGQRMFKTPEKVDTYRKQERDSWGR